MVFKQIQFGSPQYAQALNLRDTVLRAPLGLQLSANDTRDEAVQIHLGVFEGEDLIGCITLQTLNEKQVRFRQMAIAPARQGRGIGSALLRYAESQARAAGWREVVLHARESVLDFYLNNAYHRQGAGFEEIGLAHVKMHKGI